jgi:mannose-6-phosphate isomerase-like protein (cupin superfamily)
MLIVRTADGYFVFALVVCFADTSIVGIVDHHCFKISFIISGTIVVVCNTQVFCIRQVKF